MRIRIGNIIIDADSYVSIPKENAVQFYRNKSSLDYIPPIKIDTNTLSDFSNDVLFIKERSKEET